MALFDDLANKLLEGGMKAASAAKEAAGIAKLTADAKAEELKMLDTYKEIGKLFCEKADGEVDPDFIPLLKKIEDAKAKIARLNEEKERMKAGAPEEEAAEVVNEEEAAEEKSVDAEVEDSEAKVEAVVEEAASVVEEAKAVAEDMVVEAGAVVEEVVEEATEAAEEVKEEIFAE